MRISDIRGAVQLATQATTGVTRIVEGVHQSVWDRLGVPGGQAPGKTRGVTGAVYGLVHDIAQITGKSAKTVISLLESMFEPKGNSLPRTPRGETFLSILNGVMGDRLVEENNPFAIPMAFRYHELAPGQQVPLINPGSSGKVLLLIHGLCLSDLQQHARNSNNPAEPGALLAGGLGYCPVYLRYNSGLHVSRNGQELSVQLEDLLTNWPEPVEELSVVAHSMGGLVVRSALHQAQQQGLLWPRQLKNIVFLGTPHHGAPLERAGNWLDIILEKIPHTRPFSALGKLRSAGITDLRYGNLLEQDWHGRDRFDLQPDCRQVVPLPLAVNCFTVAATLAEKRGILSDRLVGDGLVPLRSALGQHDEPSRNLDFPESSQWIAWRTSHMELLNSPAVNNQILQWLSSETA
jgi:pimeloyl-ACP methyl ester carboxylesterase